MDRLVFQQIDFDLAERIIASGPIKRAKPAKTKRTGRPAASYRGSIRNHRRVVRAAQLAAKRRAA